jgi:hypothetical protein
VRKIAAQFGVDPSTVQRISRPAALPRGMHTSVPFGDIIRVSTTAKALEPTVPDKLLVAADEVIE